MWTVAGRAASLHSMAEGGSKSNRRPSGAALAAKEDNRDAPMTRRACRERRARERAGEKERTKECFLFFFFAGDSRGSFSLDHFTKNR